MPSAAWKQAAGVGAVNHPHSRYRLLGDPYSTARPRPPIAPEYNDAKAFLACLPKGGNGFPFLFSTMRGVK
ncbi:hypothetical protein U9M48_025626 [Paspalum notatum var. saurae]|uniref:Uncharacterized protein n=1 Tax=Paspalum notatum var. saurae TaxID=547442 RepID=A0AAQ3TP56_PASNO